MDKELSDFTIFHETNKLFVDEQIRKSALKNPNGCCPPRPLSSSEIVALLILLQIQNENEKA